MGPIQLRNPCQQILFGKNAQYWETLVRSNKSQRFVMRTAAISLLGYSVVFVVDDYQERCEFPCLLPHDYAAVRVGCPDLVTSNECESSNNCRYLKIKVLMNALNVHEVYPPIAAMPALSECQTL